MERAATKLVRFTTSLRLRLAVLGHGPLWVFAIYGVWKILLLRTMVVAGANADASQNHWNRYFTQDIGSWALPFANWDGQHYLLLSQNGYSASRGDSQAFYPLFPLLTRAVTFLVHDVYVAAFTVTTVFGLLFVLLFHAILKRLGVRQESAYWGIVLFLSYPSAFYITAFYSESVALFVFMGFFYLYAVRKQRLSVLFALLLPWVKGQGFFLGALLLIDLAVSAVRKQKRDLLFATVNLLAVGAGAAALFVFYKLRTGNAFAAVDAQKQFVFNISISKIFSPDHFLKSFFSASEHLFAYNNGIMDKLFMGFTFVCFCPVAFSKDWRVIFMFAALALPAAMMGDGSSFIRHSLLVWPLVVLSILRQNLLSKMALCVLSALLLILQTYFATRFAENLWVG